MGDIVVVLVAWAMGLHSSESRTTRFVAIAGVYTVVWAVALIGGAPPVVRFTILAILIVITTWPQLIGVSAVTRAEARADVLIDRLASIEASDVQSRHDRLEEVRRLVPDDGGRLVAARMRLWAAARLHDPQLIGTLTPASYFQQAATRFLRDAQWRRVIGWRGRATAWDEGMALRSFHEEAASLLPTIVYPTEGPTSVPEWAMAVADVLADLAAMPLRDALADEARGRLTKAIRAVRAVSIEEFSDATKQRQAETAAAMRAAWQGLSEHLDQLRAERG